MKELAFAQNIIENKLKLIRSAVPERKFDLNKLAEVETSEFFFEGETVRRIMVVLRATGCEHYISNYGCSMCAHFNGTPEKPVKVENYINQWESIINGTAIEDEVKRKTFNINDFPVICLYNLGSLLNPNEVPQSAVREIFKSINTLQGIKKIIIESRAEYVTEENLDNIKEVYSGVVEIGIGLESKSLIVRELCHHKRVPSLDIYLNSVKVCREKGFRSLAYINLKPPFLTEKEAIDDAIDTAVYAFENGFDAISIEPTSLQPYSLTDYLYSMGLYRVPWLWSVREVVKGIYEKLGSIKKRDIRIGGYFDEEVLSGSQGVGYDFEKNEIFPHTTSQNCNLCTEKFIQAIKLFNKTYDVNVLYDLEGCQICYPVWKATLGVKDSRTIQKRIIETFPEDGEYK